MFAYLKQSTASQTKIVGPFIDDTDFKTVETGLTINNTDVKLSANGGTAANKNSGGGTHIANGAYALTFDATDTATVGELNGSIKVSGALVVFFKFWVLEEAVYDDFMGASAPGYLKPTTATRTLDITAGGTAGIDWGNVENPTTAVDLSATDIQLCDTTTTNTDMVGTDNAALATALATVDTNVDAILVDTAAMQPLVAKIPLSDGSITWNSTALASINAEVDTGITDAALATAANLATVDSNVDAILLDTAEIGAAGAGLTDITLNSASIDLVWDEVLTGGTHNVTNSAGKKLRQIAGSVSLSEGTLDAATASTVDLETGVASTIDDFHLNDKIVITNGTGVGQSRVISSYNGTGSVAGISPDWVTTPDNTSEYSIISGSVHTETQKNGYTNSSIHIAASGVSGTVPYNNGIEDNPLDDGTLSDAVTLDASLGFNHYTLGKGASITLASTYTAHIFNGIGGTIALGGQSTSLCTFRSANVSGIQTGGGRTFWESCRLSGPSTITDAAMTMCSINGTITLSDTGSYSLKDCYASDEALEPEFDFTSTGNTELLLLQWDGPLNLSNVGNTGTDSVVITGNGAVTLNASCTGGTIKIMGNFQVTDNSAGSTVTYDDTTTNVDAILVDTADMQPKVAKIPLSDGSITWNSTALASINAEVDTGITDAALATAANLATVDSNVDAILLDTAEIGTAGAGLTDLGGMSTSMKAEVNAEIVDTLNVDTYAEPAQGAPASTQSIVYKLGLLYKNLTNRTNQTSSLKQIYNDDATTVDHKITVSDNGTTFEKGAIVTGP